LKLFEKKNPSLRGISYNSHRYRMERRSGPLDHSPIKGEVCMEENISSPLDLGARIDSHSIEVIFTGFNPPYPLNVESSEDWFVTRVEWTISIQEFSKDMPGIRYGRVAQYLINKVLRTSCVRRIWGMESSGLPKS
jgi:hypothetical protein